MRLTAKLSLILVALSLSVLGSSMGLLYFAERQHLLDQVLAEQATGAEKLARVCADSVLDDNELLRLTYLKTFWSSARPNSIRWLVFFDVEGRVLMHSDFLKGDLSSQGTRVSDPALLQLAAAEGPIRRHEGAVAMLAVPVRATLRRIGTAAIGYDAAELERAIAEVQRESFVRYGQAVLLGTLLSLVFALVIARMLARPIRELGSAAQRIGTGKLDTRIESRRSDEIGDLAREFNTMAQKLAELDELKENFLSSITHDLRNPLSAMTGYLELVIMGIQGPIADKAKASLEVALQSGNYLAELINNILDLTKLEAGKVDLSPEPIRLAKAAEDVVSLMKVKADEYKIALGAAVPEAAMVQADAEALKRLLLNLVSNALKFTPQGGRVTIEYAKLETGEDCVRVRDTGIGIPKDKLQTLFQKFSQIAETKNKVRETKGTGLGLVICKQLAEAHGGRIWVESEYGRGTVFAFALPPAPAAKPAVAAR